MLSPYMVRDQERMETVFENPFVFMTNKALEAPERPDADAQRRWSRPAAARDPVRERRGERARDARVTTRSTGRSQAVAVRAPGFGHRRIQHLGDIAAFCGGTVIAEEAGLSLEDVDARATSARPGACRHGRTTAPSSRAAAPTRPSRAGWRSCAWSCARAVHDRDVEILQRADRAAVGQAGRDPRRRAERGRPAGALPAHRGRAGRDPGGDVRGRRPRRRHRAAALRERARRTRAGGRLRARRRDRPLCLERAVVLDRLQRRLRRPGDDRPGAARCPTGTA